MSNVLFRLSYLNGLPIIDSPQVGKVSKKDGSPNEKGVPDYLVEPTEYGYGKGELLDEVQLVDFGECLSPLTFRKKQCTHLILDLAFFISSPPESIHTPMSFHPPELVFRRPLTEAVDIWNLGCTVRASESSLHIH
jgi:serine/threonine-protein kinase SRPK3